MNIKLVIERGRNVEGAETRRIEEIWIGDQNISKHVENLRFKGTPMVVGREPPDWWDSFSSGIGIIILELKDINIAWERRNPEDNPLTPNWARCDCCANFIVTQRCEDNTIKDWNCEKGIVPKSSGHGLITPAIEWECPFFCRGI